MGGVGQFYTKGGRDTQLLRNELMMQVFTSVIKYLKDSQPIVDSILLQSFKSRSCKISKNVIETKFSNSDSYLKKFCFNHIFKCFGVLA